MKMVMLLKLQWMSLLAATASCEANVKCDRLWLLWDRLSSSCWDRSQSLQTQRATVSRNTRNSCLDLLLVVFSKDKIAQRISKLNLKKYWWMLIPQSLLLSFCCQSKRDPASRSSNYLSVWWTKSSIGTNHFMLPQRLHNLLLWQRQIRTKEDDLKRQTNVLSYTESMKCTHNSLYIWPLTFQEADLPLQSYSSGHWFKGERNLHSSHSGGISSTAAANIKTRKTLCLWSIYTKKTK